MGRKYESFKDSHYLLERKNSTGWLNSSYHLGDMLHIRAFGQYPVRLVNLLDELLSIYFILNMARYCN